MTLPPSKEEIKAAADRAETRSRGGQTAAEEIIKAALSEGELSAEIKKLAALPIGVFETSRAAEARRLGMRTSVLELLVKAERTKTTKEQKDFLPHWKVEPSSESVNGAALLDELRNYFLRHAALPNHADVVLALWPLHTWVFDCFDITPYLVITSPTRRCGKSLVLTILQWLCCRAKKNDSMSKAAIYRSVENERPTLVLDEVGWVVDLKDERQGILCGGFERNGFVEVCEGDSANITVRRYSTYCPKAFGLIGKLTTTLMDRSIEIAMQRKTKLDKVDRLGRRDNDVCAKLRRRCLRWANDNRKALAAITPKAPDGLNDRALDIWEPLFAVADLVGGKWPKLAREAAITLSGGDPNTEEKGVELLGHIKVEFGKIEFSAMTTKALIDVLCSDKERPWATWNRGEKPITDRHIARLLSEFQIISETVHPYETGEVKDAKGYKRAHFGDAFDRYLTTANDASPQFTGPQASCRPNAHEMGISSVFCVRPETDQDGYEKCEKPADDGGWDARTDKNPKNPREELSDQPNGGNGTGEFRCDVVDVPDGDALTTPTCAQCGAGRPGDLPTVPVTAENGTTGYVHEHGCLRFWKKEHAPILDCCNEPPCDHCGLLGGAEWVYDRKKVRLHSHCEDAWLDARRKGGVARMESQP